VRAAVLSFRASLVLCASVQIAHAQSLSAFGTQKAERLLRSKHSCLGCHSLKGEGGQLAPSLDDVRSRRDAAYIAAMISDPQHTRPGVSMPRVRMPAGERALIVRYLGGDPARIVVSPAPAIAATTDGKTLYAQWCAGCHGMSGKGDGPNAKSLPVVPAKHSDTNAMSARSDDALFDTIEAGGAIMNRSHRMPAFGGSLNTAQIRALVQYIRTLCNCQGPAWSRDGTAAGATR
jgi:mono/diheme cytochrome c family protein